MMTRYLLALCFDFGDTLVDEATEVKDETLVTLRAELIPGAGQLVRLLKEQGYKTGLWPRQKQPNGKKRYWTNAANVFKAKGSICPPTTALRTRPT